MNRWHSLLAAIPAHMEYRFSMRIVTVLFCCVVALWADDEKLESPSEARQRIMKLGQVGGLVVVEAMRVEAARYLALWEKADRKAVGRELLDLGTIQLWAERFEAGLAAVQSVAKDESLDAALREDAGKDFGLALARCYRELSPERIGPTRKTLAHVLKTGNYDNDRMALALMWQASAKLAYIDGDTAAVIASCRSAVEAQAQIAPLIIGLPVAAQMSGVYRMEDYAGLRKRVAEITDEFKQSAMQPFAARRTPTMAAMLDRMFARRTQSVALLGEPAKVWTVEHAFQGPSTLAEHKGKVVLIYLWQTQHAQAVRGLAAMRDLGKRYAKQNLAIVGVTSPARSVYPARYELDADIDRETGPGMEPIQLAPRERDPETVKSFRARETKMIAEFLRNHEIAWPTVMIPQKEALEAFGAAGPMRPTIVLIDAKGRLRYIKSSPIRRGSKVASTELPTVIDALLKEAE